MLSSINRYKNIHQLLLSKMRDNKLALVILAVSILITTSCNLIIPKIFGSLAITKNTDHLFLLGALFILKMLFQYILSYKTTYLSNLFSFEIRKDFIDNVIHSDQQKLNAYSQGDIFHRIFNELGSIQGKLIFGTIYFIKDFIFFVFLLVNILVISKILFVILIGFALLFYLYNHWEGKKIATINKGQTQINASLSAYFIEILNGKEDVKIFNIENKIKKKIDLFSSKFIPLIKRNARQQSNNYLFIETMLFLFICSVVMVLITEGLDTSIVITSTIYILLLLWPIREMNLYISSVYSIVPSLDRVEGLLNELNFSSKNASAKNSHFKIILQQKELSLDIRALNFGYEGKPLLLKNLNYKFTKGSYLLKGNNGSGKTTFLKIISGILPATSGELIIGYDQHEPLKHARLIQQVPFLFSGTILENLKIVNTEISETQINKLLADYDLEDVFNEFEHKLQTQIGENGRYISSGQKQLISILRALIEDPPILLLDEITSHLSEKLQTEIVNNIYKNRKDKINIFISHQSPQLVKHDNLILF